MNHQLFWLLINCWFESYFSGRKTKFCDSSFFKVNIFWFLSSSVTVNWIFLGCGQNETFEDVVLGFWETLICLFLLYGTHHANHYHIFWGCPVIKPFWEQLCEHLNNIFTEKIPCKYEALYLGDISCDNWTQCFWQQAKRLSLENGESLKHLQLKNGSELFRIFTFWRSCHFLSKKPNKEIFYSIIIFLSTRHFAQLGRKWKRHKDVTAKLTLA